MKSRFNVNLLAAVVICFAAPAAVTHAANLAPEKVNPPDTKVLLLPSLDREPMKTVMAPLRVMIMNHHLESVFLTRDFSVLGPNMAQTSATTLGIDVADAGNMTKLAQQSGADWVIGTAITDSSLKPGASNTLNITVNLHVNIYDAKRKGWLMDKDFVVTKNSGAIPIGPMGMYQMGIEAAIDTAIGPLIADYPQIVKLGDVGTNDYLPGQKEPFVGDPKKEFDGLPTP